ncbi:MAG: TetR family transcriptional regulator [Solirubrobacteraceae bacterium]
MSAEQRAVVEVPVRDGVSRTGRRVGRGQVSDIQRARMLTAMVDVLGEYGVRNVTVAHVVARSGVSRRTFYEVFVDREDCFLAAFEDAIAKIAAFVVPAYEQETGWREQIRAGLVGLLEFLDCEPSLGRLVFVEVLGAGPRALARRARLLSAIVEVLDRGRVESRLGGDTPSLTAEGVVGAVLSVLHTRLLADPTVAEPGSKIGTVRSGGLVELVNPLMAMIVLPYLGSTASRRELARPVPKRRAAVRQGASSDPLRDLEMRLTYRTVMVLTAVATNPGSSNRTIGDAAGMTDQGQTSKLLARLQGLGLVENLGAGHARGGPNAWALTPKGWEIHAAINAA